MTCESEFPDLDNSVILRYILSTKGKDGKLGAIFSTESWFFLGKLVTGLGVVCEMRADFDDRGKFGVLDEWVFSDFRGKFLARDSKLVFLTLFSVDLAVSEVCCSENIL